MLVSPTAPSWASTACKLLKDYNAIARAGIDDDGFRAGDPTLRLQDMDRDGVARVGDLRAQSLSACRSPIRT